MKKKLLKKILLTSILFILGLQAESYAQTKQKTKKTETTQETEEFYTQEELEELKALKKELEAIALKEKEEALRLAKIHGWEIKIRKADSTFMELQKVVDGKPIYNSTNGIKTTKSTRTNHLHTGGSLGLNLMGQEMTAYVWDGGKVRVTHQEFDGSGGTNRVSMMDKASELNDHAQHVTGIIAASGVKEKAKGVAPHIKAKVADWNNDEAEVTEQIMNKMLVSNHSYGASFRNDKTGALQIPQYYFGGYVDESGRWDDIMFKASKYLMVVAAGNDGLDNSANKNPNTGFGFDKLITNTTPKNNLVVANAQDVHVDDNGNFVSALINPSSNQGPTDDFRIKPDITAVGTNVYSTITSNDKAYKELTGTSMATPNVTGSLLLLQQHHKNVHKKYMKAATLKGLALHTADDAGVTGPDAIFGWGVLNAKRAAQTITQKGKETRIEELTLKQGQTYKITVTADGTNPLLASISWTDRPGVVTKAINSRIPVLVNDLDLRISKDGTTYLPYKLTGATTNAKTDNNVDPFERIGVDGASGTYTITVTHKGTLTGGSQNYSLIVTGITDASVVCDVTEPKEVAVANINASTASLNWNLVSGASYDVRYRKAGTSSWTIKEVSADLASLKIEGLSALTRYEAQVRSKCASGNSAYSASVNFTTFCESKATNGKDQYIREVVLNTINKASTDTKGYSDYTSMSTKLAIGATNTIIITPKSTAAEAGYGVWIDYNQDGNFEDTEKVFTKDKSKDVQVSGTFTVPSSAKTGTTKMRVVLKKNGTPTACETFAEGEVEEYTVIIDPKDTTAPTAPEDLRAYNITRTSVRLSYKASVDNRELDRYYISRNGKLLGYNYTTDLEYDDLQPNTSYTYRIVAKDKAGNESKASSVTFKTLASDYCTAKATNKEKLYIKKVELGCINTASSGGAGYLDHTTYSVTDIIKGVSNKITITPSDNRSEVGYGVWIDYNKDGKFDDSEKVWSLEPSKVTKAIGNFTIPSTVEDGRTRMRVVLKKNGTPTACETFAEGEVEDHTITIITTDTKPPTVPSNVTVSNVAQTKARVSWSASLDNIGVTEYEIFNGETVLKTTTNTYYTITDLKPSTRYVITVKAKDKAGNVSATSNTVTFTTNCVAKANSSKEQYISKVVLGNINKSSDGGNGYSDHTSISTNLAKGATNTITITPKSTAAEAGYGVWIDYNQDGDFDDTGEKVWTKNKSKETQVTGTFTVPSSAKNGATIMRVVLKKNGTPAACETFEEGEVEDYTVTIVSKFAETEPPTIPNNLKVTNVSQTSGVLSWDASTDNHGVAEYEIFRDGKLIHSTRETSYTLTGLASKTSYTLAVLAKDAAGNTSLKSKTVTFKTHCIAKATNATNQYIKRIELGTIDHYSTSEGGYSDYTSISTKLAKGATNTIAITPKNTASDAWYTVWIDYNRDGEFEEGEKVFAKDKSKDARVSGTFTIPATAKLGKTTMRVALQNNAAPTSCGAFAEGEVEEYTVNIVKEGTDVTPHTAIRDLKTSHITQTSVKLIWGEKPDSEGAVAKVFVEISPIVDYKQKDTYGTSVVVANLKPNTTYTVNIVLIDKAGNRSKPSKAVTFTTLCKSKATNGKDQYISKVVLGNIDNTSTDTEGYSDYTTSETIRTNLAKETANTITITPKSTTSDAWYAVWVDYNRNGKFEDTEKVFTKDKSKDARVSGTFTIPSTIKEGSATMRVAISNKNIGNACSSFSEGEVEDYIINIVKKGSDVTPPKAPSNVIVSNITQTSATLTYDNIKETDKNIDNIHVFTTSEEILDASNKGYTSLKLDNLKANTTYSVQLYGQDKAGNRSKPSNVVTFTTYCESKATNGKDQYISKVVLNTIDNSSTDTKGYSDYISISTKLAKGAANTITITPKSTATESGYGVWIDYNKDGKFEDTEKAWAKTSKEAKVNGTFTIPATAKLGKTRMRVVLKKNGTPAACETFAEGEVEEYTINILPEGSDVTPPKAPSNVIVSNITQTRVLLSYDKVDEDVDIYSYEIIKSSSNENNKIGFTPYTDGMLFTNLKPNTTYTLQLFFSDKAGNRSKPSNAVTFTTLCESKATNGKDQYISKVVLNTINNASTDTKGYSDYTSISTKLAKGDVNTISITPKSTATESGYGVWIDYNKDGKFEDTEKAWAKTSKEAKVSGTFTIPATAKLGETRMRVVLKKNGTPTTCGTFAEGEVEEYTINIIPKAPSNVIVSNIASTTVTLTYDNVLEKNEGVSGVVVYADGKSEKLETSYRGVTSLKLINLKPNTTYTVRVFVHDKAKNLSKGSRAVTFTTYCESKATNGKDQYISKVVLNTINNASTDTKGYSDYTSISTKLAKGDVNTISITPKSTATESGYGVWIDYNKDGKFEDTEKAWAKTSKEAKVNGTFTIPATAKLGKTRMRVVLKKNGTPTACETFAEGEVEEYTINIIPAAPTNFKVSNITQTGAKFSWDASKYNIRRIRYGIWNNKINKRVGNLTTNTFNTVTGLKPNTTYTLIVYSLDSAGNYSEDSNAVTFTTLCESKATNGKDQYISKVVLNTINNASTDTKGYSDYTSISTKLAKGDVNTISITPKSTATESGYGVWIDYNKDGKFEDTEKAWAKTSKEAKVNGTFTIPATAKLGKTRMRVVLKKNGTPAACETFAEGEVEDYTVNILPKDTEAPTAPVNLVVSNITKTEATISWDTSKDNIGIAQYEVFNGETSLGTTTGTSYKVSNLKANTEYTVSVKAKDRAGNVSKAGKKTFKTQDIYCVSKGSNSTYRKIDYVSFGGMTNTSGDNGGYADFTSKVATVIRGTTNRIRVNFCCDKKPSGVDSSYSSWGVWIDFNKDGVFGVHERVVSLTSVNGYIDFENDIEIPLSAVLGSTRMRVSIKYGENQTACETFAHGEVEDYTVNITDIPSSSNARTQTLGNEIMVYPNPASDYVQVKLANSKAKNLTYSIINIFGQVVKYGLLNSDSISVYDIIPGTYVLEVYDGQKLMRTRLVKK